MALRLCNPGLLMEARSWRCPTQRSKPDGGSAIKSCSPPTPRRIFMERKKLRAVVTRVNRYLKQTTGMSAAERSNHLSWREAERLTREAWLAEHPGRTANEYARLLGDSDGEVWKWRRAKGEAAIAAEAAAWLSDHPDRPLPEHLCTLSDAEYREYGRWQRRREPPKKTATESDQVFSQNFGRPENVVY
jgi:hypothetical protein